MNWKKFLITSTMVLLTVIIAGCTPEISKEDLKITDIIWFEVDGESYAKIEAEAFVAPLIITTEVLTPYKGTLLKNDTFWEIGCTSIVSSKGKSIITESCLGDPYHSLMLKTNSTVRICFNYRKTYSKENRICLDPLTIEK